MRRLWRRFLVVLWSAAAAFVILVVGTSLWGMLLFMNFKSGPAFPWSIAVMAAVLWVMWQYLGGKWWPRSTSDARRRYLRANRVTSRTVGWSLLAGALAIAALAGYWIVLFQMVKMPANVLPSMAGYPLATLILVLLMASLVAPICEEAACRGYCQVKLEEEFSPRTAIVISSVVFSLAHLTHGFFWPKLLVYFLVGLTFGAIAYFANSILASIPVHILGDLGFFTLVWPHDATRRMVWDGGADAWFWVHVAQAMVFTTLALAAFRRLAKITAETCYAVGARAPYSS
jgi:membrane protease YdiL (CAAX protease family)